ncbi:MAG TPA: ABC transporter permease subunit [Mycobacteriales bacterium]|jgi:ABC-type transport system involved in multi-copper enzyme maturation permease subunit|nr:ABC transporter permease subunit [Mycobacteriales bacterium]
MTSFNRGIAAEWIKLRSLRSSWWTLGAMVVASIGLATLVSATNAHGYSGFSAADKASWDPTNVSLSGTVFGQLAIAVFGVLAITGEFASGTIRTSIAATPRRRRLLAAKAVVYGGVALVIGEVLSLAAFFIGQPIIARHAPHASFGEPGVARAVLFAGVYLALICLISLGLATLVRHTAGAITAVVALLLVVPAITSALPSSFQHSVGKFMPELIGGNSMGAVVPEPHSLTPLVGAAVLCLYAVVMLAAAGWALARRDVV